VADDLDRQFAALANRNRRAMVHQLGTNPASISRLAKDVGLSLPAMNKHVGVLEAAGLVVRRKLGRTTFLTLDRTGINDLQAWLGQFHPYWGSDDDTLESQERYLAGDAPSAKEEP
jgi:DNA-binding transcriptional ArsR family regulator